MKLLLVKLSSLGDLLHVFPALSELQKIDPALEVTWVVESGFKEVPFWHPAVKEVIEAPLRQIKKASLFVKIRNTFELLKQIRREQYDVVIDAQGLFKSAMIAKFARGKSIGFGKGSSREAVWWLYNKRVNASWDWHAIARQEVLFSALFPIEVGLEKAHVDYALAPWQPVANKVLFFAHGTTWSSKHYPDILWRELVKLATDAGYQVWLPFVNDQELKRAEFLKVNSQVTILPKMSITQIRDTLYEVAGMVAVDTGLAHIAAALGVPAVTVYGPTEPAKIGTVGRNQKHLTAVISCAPCEKKQCFHPDRFEPPSPPCFRTVPPEQILQTLETILNAD